MAMGYFIGLMGVILMLGLILVMLYGISNQLRYLSEIAQWIQHNEADDINDYL